MKRLTMYPADLSDLYAFTLATRVSDREHVDRYVRFVRKLGITFVLSVYRQEVRRRSAEPRAGRLRARLEAVLSGKETHAE